MVPMETWKMRKASKLLQWNPLTLSLTRTLPVKGSIKWEIISWRWTVMLPEASCGQEMGTMKDMTCSYMVQIQIPAKHPHNVLPNEYRSYIGIWRHLHLVPGWCSPPAARCSFRFVRAATAAGGLEMIDMAPQLQGEGDWRDALFICSHILNTCMLYLFNFFKHI